MRTGFRTLSSIAVAVVTAGAVAYVAVQQDMVFDAIDDTFNDDPLVVRPFQDDMAFSLGPLVLPAVLAADRASTIASPEGYQELFESTHAVPLARSSVDLTIEGNRHESVVVERITAHVVERTEAPAGTLVGPYPGGGPEEKIILEFNLDKPDKRARIPRSDGSLEVFDEHNYFEIRRGEKFVFTFQGVTRQPYKYTWVVDFVVQVGGRHATVTLGAGSPFLVSGPVERYAAYYARDVDWRMHAVPAEEICPQGCIALGHLWTGVG